MRHRNTVVNVYFLLKQGIITRTSEWVHDEESPGSLGLMKYITQLTSWRGKLINFMER